MKTFIVLIGVLLAMASAMAEGELSLTSPSFNNNEEIPSQYTCQGSDINPPLEIKNIPSKTKSLALTVTDPDAPEGIWVHWVVNRINPSTSHIAQNSNPGVELLNDFGKYHYAGPCPSNDQLHHYIFQLYALDAVVDINEGSTIKDLEKAIKRHIIGKASWTGTHRKPVF